MHVSFLSQYICFLKPNFKCSVFIISRFNNETKNESGSETQETNQKEIKDDEQQTEEVEIGKNIYIL